MLALIAALHGAVHFMGFVTYLDLGEIEGLNAATVLVGRDDVPGAVATSIGVFWLIAGVGFIVGAAGIAGRRTWSRNLVFALTAISVALAIMALPDAWASIPINMGIAAAALVFFIAEAQNSRVDYVRSALLEHSDGDFEPSMVKELPEPVQRYLLHAIAPGAPLARSATLRQEGVITAANRKEMPFVATQALTPAKGFTWVAKTKGLLSLTALDYYFNEDARTRVAIYNVFPIINSHDQNTVRSARGRLLIESIWVPTTLLPGFGVRWKVEDERHLVASIPFAGEKFDIKLEIDDEGSLRSANCLRFGDPDGDENWRLVPFGGSFTAEATFDEFTIPSEVHIGWKFGTPDYSEFFRGRLTDVEFLV
jgi:hypothetical protein